MSNVIRCPTCKGIGFVNAAGDARLLDGEPCKACDGRGVRIIRPQNDRGPGAVKRPDTQRRD